MAEASECRVGVAQLAVATAGTLTTVGLGSCVAVALHDADARVAALAHVLLPHRDAGRAGGPAKFADAAVPALIAAAVERGARRDRLRAKIAGGATMFANLLATSGVNIGERNAQAVRAALARAGIPLVAEDVGGGHGRSVVLHVASGAMEVRSLRRPAHVL